MNILTINDFNNAVNGKWLKNTKIPDDKDDWGTFNILRDENMKKETYFSYKKISHNFYQFY